MNTPSALSGSLSARVKRSWRLHVSTMLSCTYLLHIALRSSDNFCCLFTSATIMYSLFPVPRFPSSPHRPIRISLFTIKAPFRTAILEITTEKFYTTPFSLQSQFLRINRTTNRNRKSCYFYAFFMAPSSVFFKCHKHVAAHNYLLYHKKKDLNKVIVMTCVWWYLSLYLLWFME